MTTKRVLTAIFGSFVIFWSIGVIVIGEFRGKMFLSERRLITSENDPAIFWSSVLAAFAIGITIILCATLHRHSSEKVVARK